MTEMMKRYEAEMDEVSTWTWHNKEFVTDDVLDWAWEKIQKLQAENTQLQAQLTWRPVSEKPKENVDVEVCDMSKPSLDEREPVIAYYVQGKWICVFPYHTDVYAYITPTHWRYIPPTPEGE